jgi:hypothetical protein
MRSSATDASVLVTDDAMQALLWNAANALLYKEIYLAGRRACFPLYVPVTTRPERALISAQFPADGGRANVQRTSRSRGLRAA